MKVLVTGTAGFIGFHMANHLTARGDTVVGLDSLNKYYDVSLKYGRLLTAGIKQADVAYNQLTQSSFYPNYTFIQLKLDDKPSLEKLFTDHQFDAVVNLAAQAGVRYSITNPDVYIQSNIVGFTNLLECCRHHNIKHLVYASSSSVYGLNQQVPFSTAQNVDHPISLYAASKKSNELMAHVYSHLFNLPTTGLRFFTVYGPWGRPDMALFIFTKSIIEGTPIPVFNEGNMVRDFTFVDDIVEGVKRVLNNPPAANPGWDAIYPNASSSAAPYKIYNIGNNVPVRLLDFIYALENELGKKAIMDMKPLQPGDLLATSADVSELIADMDYKPNTSIKKGIKAFISWYKNYYNIQ